MVFSEKFGHILLRVRKERGRTRYWIAKASGLPEGTIANYEQKNTTPSIDKAERIFAALGLELALIDTATGERYEI